MELLPFQSIEGHEVEEFGAAQVCRSSPCWPRSRKGWGMPSSSCRANTSWLSTSMTGSGLRCAGKTGAHALHDQWVLLGASCRDWLFSDAQLQNLFMTSCLCPGQIHLHTNGDVRVFSRNCEERTGSFPDVADAIRSAAAGEAIYPFRHRLRIF